MYPDIRRPLPFASLAASQGERRAPVLRVENAKAEAADVYLYAEIGFWGVTAADFQRELAGVTAKRINLHVNSPGGDVFDGIAIYTLLRDHPAAVTTYVDGLAASAASFISLAGERVVIAKSAYMMIHEAMGIVWGYASDMRRQADILDKLSDTIAEVYEDRAGGTRQQWRDAMAEETWYTASEAVAAGLADEVSGEADGDGRASNRWDLSAFDFRNTPAELLVQRLGSRVAAPAARAAAAAPAASSRSEDGFDIWMHRARLAVATAELGGK